MSNFIGNCERCEKIGFDMCKCPKPSYNYQLKIMGHTQPIAGYVDHLIKLGKEYDTPFTIEMLEPSMVVCYWQPGIEVAYNEYYQRWYEAQQVGLQRVME